MAKYRGRKFAGVSIANPRRIIKNVAQARAYASLHFSDGLKEESMKTPRSFADSTISTDFPSANVREAIDGCPMGRWGGNWYTIYVERHDIFQRRRYPGGEEREPKSNTDPFSFRERVFTVKVIFDKHSPIISWE